MSNEEINQKAIELFDRYYSIKWQIHKSTRSYKVGSMSKSAAKQCALILCDEMIKEYAVLQIETSFCYKLHLEWVAIKQAIEQL